MIWDQVFIEKNGHRYGPFRSKIAAQVWAHSHGIEGYNLEAEPGF